jgi:hypothetical protein
MPYGLILRILGPLLIAGIVFMFGFSNGEARIQRKWDLATAAQVKAQLAATDAARAKEQAWQFQLTEAQRNGQLEKDRTARVIASLRTERDGLRQSIAGFTSARPDDTAEAYRERCASTGNLLQEALRVSEACAADGERVSSDLRTLLMAWPN